MRELFWSNWRASVLGFFIFTALNSEVFSVCADLTYHWPSLWSMRRTKRSRKIGWRRPRDATVDDASRGADSTPFDLACLMEMYKEIVRFTHYWFANSSSGWHGSWPAGFLFSGWVGVIRRSRTPRRFGRTPIVVFYCALPQTSETPAGNPFVVTPGVDLSGSRFDLSSPNQFLKSQFFIRSF